MAEDDLPTGNYEERYFAFVDILGFQGLIEQLKRGNQNPVAFAEAHSYAPTV
jgi:hypothetical protein